MKKFTLLLTALSVALYVGSAFAETRTAAGVTYLGSYDLERWINASQAVKDSGVPEKLFMPGESRLWYNPYTLYPSPDKLKEARVSIEQHITSLTTSKQEALEELQRAGFDRSLKYCEGVKSILDAHIEHSKSADKTKPVKDVAFLDTPFSGDADTSLTGIGIVDKPLWCIGNVAMGTVEGISSLACKLIPKDATRTVSYGNERLLEQAICLGRNLKYDPTKEYIGVTYTSSHENSPNWGIQDIKEGRLVVVPSSGGYSNPDIQHFEISAPNKNITHDSEGNPTVHIPELTAFMRLKHDRCVQKQYGLNTTKTTFRCDGKMHTVYAQVCALNKKRS